MPRIDSLTAATALLMAVSALPLAGCGTTRSTDTTRSATEQLLISDAIDRAVQTVSFQALAGQTVFLDDSRLGDAVDRNYLVSTLRQHLLASGCELRDQKDQADFIVEARAGAVGTDRNDLLFGVPSMNVPQILPLQPAPAAIPEIPIAKRRDQRAVAKLAVFAYHRETGTPVWQSGIAHEESSSNDVWILGAGPFQRGTIYEGTAFAGKTIGTDSTKTAGPSRLPALPLAQENLFTPPERLATKTAPATAEQAVVPADHQQPAASGEPSATAQAAVPSASPSGGNSQPSSSAAAVSPSPAATLTPQNEALQPAMALQSTDVSETRFSAEAHEPPAINRTPSYPAKALFAQPYDPARLPQPRFNSPR